MGSFRVTRRSCTSSTRCSDRKSTRLNSSHANISYAVFCLKKNIGDGGKNHLFKRPCQECRNRRYPGAHPAGLVDSGHRESRQHRPWERHYSFFFNDTATTEIYTLSLHDALPI